MSLTSFNLYRALVTSSNLVYNDGRASFTSPAQYPVSSWTNTTAIRTGQVPSSSVTCSSNTQGALGQGNTTASYGQLLSQVHISENAANPGMIMVIDRLVMHAGLSGVVSISAQTTNLPTTTLPRYTGSYVGTMVGLEIYTGIGGTSVLVSGSYTNQSGVSGRTFVQSVIGGGSTFAGVGRLILLPLQEGDTGVQSVQSIVLSNTTGTAGNFGVTIFYPILMIPTPVLNNQSWIFDSILSNGGQMGLIQNNACLQYLYWSNNGTWGIWSGEFRFISV